MLRPHLAVAALVLGVAALHADGQCQALLRNVAQVQQFPNRPAAHIAWTGSVYGVLRVEPQTRSYPIYFTLFDGELNPKTADRLIADTTLDGPLALLWTGTEFGVFYQSLANQLYLQRLDVIGTPIGGPIPILPEHSQIGGMEYDLAWNAPAGGYAITHTIPTGVDRGLYVTLITPDGTVLVDRVISYLLGTPTTPRVAVTSNGSMGVLWNRDDGLYFALYGPTVAPGPSPQPVAPVAARPTLATNGSSFGTVFTTPGSGTPELHWVGISSTAAPGTDKKLATATGLDIAPISLTWAGTLGEYALAYVDAPNGLGHFPTDTRLRRLSTSGGTIADTKFSPDPFKTDYAVRYPVIFDGTSFLGGMLRFISNAEGSEAYLARHCPLRVSLAADQGANVPLNTLVTFRATPNGGFGGYTYFWDFGDLHQTTGNAVITHRYDRLGTYQASVTSTDSAGVVQTATFTIVVSRPKQRLVKH